MEIRIEKALIADLEVLNEISISSKAFWKYPKAWLELWEEDMKLTPQDITQQHVYKLIEAQGIIGFCAIFETEEQYEIEHLWILPTAIGKGYGKYLMEYCMQKVITKDKPIVVVVDPNAEGFYQKQGFETYAQKESLPKGRFLPLMRKGS